MLRNNVKTLLLSLVLVFALTSEIAAQTITSVTESYRGRRFDGATLAIVPLPQPATVKNPSDVTKHLGSGDPVEVFMTFFMSTLAANLRTQTSFRDVRYLSHTTPPVFETITLRQLSGFEEIEIKLPSDRKPLPFD